MKLKKSKKLFEKYLEYWRIAFALNNWNIDVSWQDYLYNADTGGKPPIAVVDVKWEYLSAYIKVNTSDFLELNESGIEEVVIHELLHVVLNEMRENANPEICSKHEERAISTLTNSFQWVKEGIVDRAADAVTYVNELKEDEKDITEETAGA